MAVATIGAAFNPLTIEVLVEFGIQNPRSDSAFLRSSSRPSFENTSFGSRPASNWFSKSFPIADAARFSSFHHHGLTHKIPDPIISQMERAAGFIRDETAENKLAKLDALLARTSTSSYDAVLFGELLSLPNDGRYRAVELAPQQKRQKTLEALTAQLEAPSRSSPILMIFEDVHWIDPTSLETLGRTVADVATASGRC